MKKTFILLLISAISQMLNAQIPSYIPKDSLVGWWPFNGNANDESGNGNHGNIQGSISFTPNRQGIINTAIMGNGSSSIEINSSKLPLGACSRTISLFFKISDLNSLKDNRELFAYGYNSPGQRFGLMLINDQIGLEYSISSNLATWTADTNWHHLVVRYSKSSDSVSIYLDNSSILNTKVSTTINTTSCCAFVGALFGPIDSYLYSFHGKIDDIAIWNRALDSTEIENIYTQQNTSNTIKFIKNSFTLSPNPVKDILNIQGVQPNANYQITNTIGQTCLQGKFTEKLDVSTLRPGVYFFKTETGTQRFVKE